MASDSLVQLGTLTLNRRDSNDVVWRVDKDGIRGWGSTGSTIDPVTRTRRGGAWAGDAFHRERYPSVSGSITAPTPALLETAEDTLNAAVTLADTRLTVTKAGRVRYLIVRRYSETLITRVNERMSVYTVSLVAPDFRKFGTDRVGSTFLPATSGGLTIPFTISFTIDAEVVSGSVSLTNPGNETGKVLLRVDGPCTGPRITHVGSGRGLVFASSLVLDAGEWLQIDMEKKTALANGQASRNGFITSREWSGFDPGSNTWAFTAAAQDPLSKLTVTATPAWK